MPPLSRVILSCVLTCLPAFAAAQPAPVATTPAPTASSAKADALKVQSMVTMSLVNASAATGMSDAKFSFAEAHTAADAQAILAQMRDVIAQNAKTDQFKTIGSNTVQKISDSIKSDADFWACKDELGQLPEMLKTQLATDQFKTTHDMSHLSPQDQKVYAGLMTHYKDLMATPPATKTSTKGEGMTMSAAMDMFGDKAMDHASGGLSKPAQGIVAGVGAVAAAPESIMGRFHEDYAAETVTWNSQHPSPSPAPVPGPPGGSGGSQNGAGGGGANGGGSNAGGGGQADGGTSNTGPAGYPPIEHLDDMVTAQPGVAGNWQMRADYRLQTGDFAGAEGDAQKALSLGGGVNARISLGEAQLALGDKPAAHAQAQAALQADPGNRRANALLHFSETYRSVGAPKAVSFGGSASDFGGPAGAGRGVWSAVMNAGTAAPAGTDMRREATNALRLNDLDGALVYANRGLSQDPNNPALLNIRAMIYARMHDYDKAAADAKAGLALAPHNVALLTNLAYAQLRGKHYKDALASSSELVSLNPNDAYAYALRGQSYGSMGDRDAMMADLDRAAALDPRYQAIKADMSKLVQLPTDQDVLFLFPGEGAPAAKTAAPGRGRSFGLLVGASALGGLLLALGLLQTVMAPLKERLTSAFTRITRTGPTVGAAARNDTAQPASVNGLVPGLIRGQYEISRQIGAGGMGMVFAGTDRSLGRPVAIKKMREELRVNPQERARFVIEAKTVAALHHPNIVDIYAIAEDGPDVYLIFEYVDGKNLHDAVSQAGRLPIAEAARVVRAAADALGYAHSRGVIHRDMKPSNLMIDARGRVKVMDFGIARMAKDAMTRFSMTNTVVGTPPYMAPEQEQGHVRRESDVYALAVCAYEMLTGKLPFIGIGAGMLMNKINMSYVAPSRAIAGLPEALDEVFAKAFQADPDKRYRTPKEFADALESSLPSTVRT